MRLHLSRLLATATLCALAAVSHAQSGAPWPTLKPISVVVPFPAGGAVDNAARLITTKLSERLQQAMVVDNVAGAAGVVGTTKAVRAAPDGYTLLVAPDSAVLVAQLVTPETVKYDGLKDLAPIGLINVTPLMLVTRPGLPVANFGDLIKYARAHPGQLNYASPGVGNILHVAMESMRQQAKIEAVHVPYKAAPQIVSDLIGNQIDMAMLVPSTAMPHLKAQKIKAMGVTVEERISSNPDVPSLSETPELKGFHFVTTIGLFAPAKTPAAIVERLNRELNEVLASPEVRKLFQEQAATPGSGTPAEFDAFLRKEMARHERVVKTAGIKAE
jgi:tripartite-type tricarboxylate transporter receptor subunit TctC